MSGRTGGSVAKPSYARRIRAFKGQEDRDMSRRHPLRWGVIGLGVGNQHALTLLADENAQLVAVCDSNAEVLEKVSVSYGQVARYENADEMLAAEDLDAVSIASYDWDHASTVGFALEHGLHVFAEKPLGTSHDDYEAIVDALRRNPHVRLTTNTLLRRSPRFAWLKDQITTGEMGSLVHIQADYLYGRLPKLTHGWRGTMPDYSVTLGGAIHMVDLMLWLAGQRPQAVTAIGSGAGAASADREGATGFAGDTLRAGLLTFASGLTASVSANFGSVGPHFHRLDVYGTAATFMNVPAITGADDLRPGSAGLLLRGPDPGLVHPVDAPYPAVPKGMLLPEFNRAILGQGETPITEQEALDAFAVCLALDDAVALAQPVSIRYEEISTRR